MNLEWSPCDELKMVPPCDELRSPPVMNLKWSPCDELKMVPVSTEAESNGVSSSVPSIYGRVTRYLHREITYLNEGTYI